jgi:hypothetical protein
MMTTFVIRGLVIGVCLACCSITRADECFCLIHPSGAILRGCEEFKPPRDQYSTALCVDPETLAKTRQTMYSEWKRIDSGADRCLVCKPVARGPAKEIPRGNDENKQ